VKTDGFFFTVNEVLDIFPRLKIMEAELEERERAVLLKMEKNLYECLSIDEIESRLERAEASFR
jgi:hypothetical protein